MLDIIEKYLPLGGEMWEQVVTEHNQTYGENDRDATSLKKKFQDLYKKKIPTGDPHIPPEVRRAKLIQKKILGTNAAADISEENGGYQGVIQNIRHARSAATMPESDSDWSNRLDGTRPMSSRRRASPPNPGDMMQMLMMQQMQQMQQYKQERREHQEECKESHEMWMGLIAAGIGLAGGNTDGITKRLFGKKQKKRKKDNDGSSSDSDSE
jgi:hypothetical protein